MLIKDFNGKRKSNENMRLLQDKRNYFRSE